MSTPHFWADGSAQCFYYATFSRQSGQKPVFPVAAGEATTRALYPAVRNPHAYPELCTEEGLDAWTVSWFWLMAAEKPNYFEDVTEKFALKLAALREHASQVSHMDNLDEMITGWLTMQAEVAGFEAGRLAEAFRQVKLPD